VSRQSWRAWEERHREEIAAKKRAEAPLPFDDLELSAWSVSLLRRHLSPEQFARMRGVLQQRVAEWRAT
jgi:hypothetical protein